MIECSNAMFCWHLTRIGGVETFAYTLARMFSARDFVIVYREADEHQLERLKQFVRCVKWDHQEVKCKRAFMNWCPGVPEYFHADEYYYIVHQDYDLAKLEDPHMPEGTHYYAVSPSAAAKFEKLTGHHTDVLYNPIIVEEPRRVLRLISATRLAPEKGAGRMEKLARMLDDEGIPFRWDVFSNQPIPFKNPNVIKREPRYDITDFIADADYLVQLSDYEGYAYTVYEALCLGVPVIVTDIPSMRDQDPVGFVLPLDMKNVPVREIYEKAGTFNFKMTPRPTKWAKLLTDDKSDYAEQMRKRYRVRATDNYTKHHIYDAKLHRVIPEGEEWIVNYERLQQLLGDNPTGYRLAELVEEVEAR